MHFICIIQYLYSIRSFRSFSSYENVILTINKIQQFHIVSRKDKTSPMSIDTLVLENIRNHTY